VTIFLGVSGAHVIIVIQQLRKIDLHLKNANDLHFKAADANAIAASLSVKDDVVHADSELFFHKKKTYSINLPRNKIKCFRPICSKRPVLVRSAL